MYFGRKGEGRCYKLVMRSGLPLIRRHCSSFCEHAFVCAFFVFRCDTKGAQKLRLVPTASRTLLLFCSVLNQKSTFARSLSIAMEIVCLYFISSAGQAAGANGL